jgi:hypothetical protein
VIFTLKNNWRKKNFSGQIGWVVNIDNRANSALNLPTEAELGNTKIENH